MAIALFAVKGVAAPETGQAYARAHKLCEQLGFPSQFLKVLYGQSQYHAYRGELDLALRLDEELLGLSVDHHQNAVLAPDGRIVHVQVFPASVEPDEVRSALRSPAAAAARERLAATSRSAPATRLERRAEDPIPAAAPEPFAMPRPAHPTRISIVVPLYKNRPPIRVVAPVPPHMRTALARCGWHEETSSLRA